MKRLIGELQNTMLLWEVLDGLHLPAFSLNADCRIIDSNNSVKDNLFFQKDEIVNLSVFDIVRIPPSMQQGLSSKKTTVLEGSCLQKNRESFSAKITFVQHFRNIVINVLN